ncbi:hypothetical protein KI387_024142, partial [Taxus chinensis]
SYVPSPLQANCLIQEEQVSVPEEQSLPPSVPDLVLDEWVERHHKFDPYAEELEAYETGLGTYYILEEDATLPHALMGDKVQTGLWKLYFDGSRSRNGMGAGVVLISPKDEKLFFTHRLQFACSNNVAEYEAL